jgi:hypothetical protein
MITGGTRLGEAEMVRLGCRVLDWLIEAQTASDEHLTTIGNQGWWPRDGVRARFDQQPIEATALLLAAEVAWEATHADRYRRAVEAAYAWFLGRNDLGLAIADPQEGGCRDGLTSVGVNHNQGAESTLMWLTALEHVRGMRGRVGNRSVTGMSQLLHRAAEQPNPSRRSTLPAPTVRPPRVGEPHRSPMGDLAFILLGS